MKRYQVTDPNGVLHGGEIVPQGQEIPAVTGSQLSAWLRFGQVELIEGPTAEELDAEPKAKADADAKAKADAEAKALAEKEAKAKAKTEKEKAEAEPKAK